MANIALTLDGLTWCWRHGHPIVGLRGKAEQVFWVTLSPDDAQALSPLYQGHNTGRSRVYELLESTLEGLGARISAITLGFRQGGILQGEMTIDGLLGSMTRPIHTVDAIVLAHRQHLPITMDEQDIALICPTGEERRNESGSATVTCSTEPPDSFRTFIESLDLGQLDQPSDQ